MNTDRLLANYERIPDAPDAIVRLRRFILDLAVRGKLVSQDASDEPGSIWLLRTFSSEVAGLGKKARAISAKPSEEVKADYTLPGSWLWMELGKLVTVMDAGWSPQCENHARSDPETWGVLKTTAVQTLAFDCSQNKELPAKFAPRPQHEAHVGDILVTRAGPKNRVGISCVVDQTEPRLMISDKLIRFRLIDGLNPKFFALTLNAGVTSIAIEDAKSGMAVMQMNISQDKLRAVPVPFPPLAEQHRIVAKVDELMGLCDRLEAARTGRERSRDRLAAASLARLNAPDPETFQDDARFALDALPALTTRPDQIKRLRQTILNLAVRGKLVPQDANDEPASELLKRLKKAQIAACANEGLRARPPVARLNRADMWFEFPESWALSSFDELFVIVSGVTKGQKVAANEAVDAPYLRVANVQRGHLDLSVIKKITVRKADEERYALRLGDVLMTEGGDWDKLGRAAIWREEIPGCIHQNHIFRVRPPSNDVSPEWVITYVNSLLGRAFFEDASKQTTNLASINMTQLRGCPFPLPPLAEQHSIVAKVESLMALCDRLEASLDLTAATRRRLLDALLAEALAPVDMAEMEAAE